jgi:alpha-methylacyl-CoA racemase
LSALADIKVVDLSHNAPGPFCSMVLADLGADVVTVFDPRPLEGRRAADSEGLPELGADALLEIRGSEYDVLARNKRSVGLHLKDPDALAILHRLIEDADVVIEEMRPGRAEALGVDYPTLSRRNPRLVYCSLTGYGQDGSAAGRPGHDLNYIGEAGALSLMTAPDGRPVIPPNLLADFAGGGLLAAVGILAALHSRQATGRGQHVDAAMTDGVIYLMAELFAAYFHSGEVPSSLSGPLPVYDVYETADGRYLTVGCLEPWLYANLCKALGRPELIELFGQPERHDELRAALRETFRSRTRDEWFETLRSHDVCVGRVLRLDEVASDERARERGMVLEVEDPGAGPPRQVGIAPRLSATPGAVRRPPFRRGEHTDEVLREAGVPPDQVAALRERGVVG